MEFAYEGLSNFSVFHLYTRAGEVTDQNLVGSFVQQYNSYFYTPTSGFSIKEFQSFSLVNDDSIIKTGIVPAGKLKRTIENTSDVYMGRYKILQNDTNAIALHLGKYKLFAPEITPLVIRTTS